MRHLFPLSFLLLGACLGDPSAHLEKGRELSFKRQPAAALREYEEVISLLAKKDSSKVRDVLAAALKGAGDTCYLELKNYQKAAEYYRALATKYPEANETLDARENLSEILSALGDKRSAVAELSTLVQSFPKGPEVDRYQYQVAKGYFELGDYDQAVLEARVLQDRFSKSDYVDDAQMLVGAAYGLQGRREKAIDAFEELGVRWPTSELAPRARYEQAKLLADSGQEEKAVEILVDALRTHPDPKGVQAEIARLRKRMAARRVPNDRASVWHEPPKAGRGSRAVN